MPPVITEHDGEVNGTACRWSEAPGSSPVLYVHGVPNDGSMWAPFLERTGGLAPDLPGFGRSAKGPHFSYSIPGYRDWLAAFLAERGVDRCSLVCHDWGAVGLALAIAEPQRFERIVLIDTVPFLPGYRWHRWARMWRAPLVGELAMGFTLKRVMAKALAQPGGEPYPEAELDAVYERFEHGTQRAILKLYRSAPERTLASAGEGLEAIEAPALVVWGERDPYIDPTFARSYADILGGEAEVIAGAGHWPWFQDPELPERVAAFLEA